MTKTEEKWRQSNPLHTRPQWWKEAVDDLLDRGYSFNQAVKLVDERKENQNEYTGTR